MRAVRLPILLAALAAALLAACSRSPEAEAPANPKVSGETPGPVEQAPPVVLEGAFAPPSFDCANSQGAVQTLVCVDPRLAELDREVIRLTTLAGAEPGLDPVRRDALAAAHAQWSARREACEAAQDLRGCVLDASVQQIFQLRQDHAHARSDDGGGISRGPSAWKCIGFDALLSSVYVNGEPASLALAWRDQRVTLQATPDPEGVRYTGKVADGDVVFVVKGVAGMFVQPGQPPLSCEIEPVG